MGDERRLAGVRCMADWQVKHRLHFLAFKVDV